MFDFKKKGKPRDQLYVDGVGFIRPRNTGRNLIQGSQDPIKTALAQVFSPAGAEGLGGSAGGSQYQSDYFMPIYDRLDEDSVMAEWMPRSGSRVNQMFRIIYLHDSVAGPTIDLFSALPWSGFDLAGIQDPKILQIYEEAMDALDMPDLLPHLTVDYLTVGKAIYNLLFDDTKGYWTGILPQDPDFVTITPVPIYGEEPILDLNISPSLKILINSRDARAIKALTKIPKEVLRKLRRGGRIPLDPLNTLYVPRRTTSYDQVGTSFLTRILPFWALEKTLISGAITAARRRMQSILHVMMGLEDKWEPEPEEMQEILSLFINADDDPVGAVVGTRNGVETAEVRDPGGMWKLSDEYSFLAEAKMRALGVSDAFLSADASWNTAETALSVFIENVLNMRASMTRRIFDQKLFSILARVHQFRKRKPNELAHGYRINNKDPNAEAKMRLMEAQYEQYDESQINTNISYKEAFSIPENDLIKPEVHWKKQLQPIGDESFLQMLDTMEEKGVPVPLKKYASHGGIDLIKSIDSMEEDLDLRRKIQDYKKKIDEIEADTGDLEEGAGDPEEGGGGDEPTGRGSEPQDSLPEDTEEAPDEAPKEKKALPPEPPGAAQPPETPETKPKVEQSLQTNIPDKEVQAFLDTLNDKRTDTGLVLEHALKTHFKGNRKKVQAFMDTLNGIKGVRKGKTNREVIKSMRKLQGVQKFDTLSNKSTKLLSGVD